MILTRCWVNSSQMKQELQEVSWLALGAEVAP
jgi:hypothetical protein